MKCISGVNCGKGIFKCDKCLSVQVLNSDADILLPCNKCNNTNFNIDLTFERSDNGYKTKFDEVIFLLEISVFMCEFLKLESFYNVIAVQLRILFIDNPLIYKIYNESCKNKLLFHPHSGNYPDDANFPFQAIPAKELFDYSKQPIKMDKWLKQLVVINNSFDPINISDIIKLWANKNGGAHVDKVLNENDMLIIVAIGEPFLLEIAKYIIKQTGYDLNNDVHEKFMIQYEISKNNNN